MLRLLEMEMELPLEEKLYSSMGSIFHGILMEKISPAIASKLHKAGLRPYSQCLYYDRERNTAIWRLGFLNDAIYAVFADILQEGRMFFLKQHNYAVTCVKRIMVKEMSYEELADSVFMAETAPDGAEFHFLTVTGFKRAGTYVIMPEAFLVFQSLLLHWNSFSSYAKLEGMNLAENLAAYSRISRYQLHSQAYSVEHRNIQGFCGTLHFRFIGNDMTNRILGLLSMYAPFAGIGIKKALGMGGTNIELYRKE